MANALANLRACVEEFPLHHSEEDTTNTHKRWLMWIENLEYCFTFEGLDDGADAVTKKKAAMLALAGQPLRELYNTLEDNANTYDAAKKVLGDYFKGTKNLTAERYKFFCMRPTSSQETHDQWVTRLKVKGKDCEFDQMNLKEAIKLVITLHTPLPKLQTAIIRDDMTFEQMMKTAQSMELAHREVSYMKSNTIDPATAQSAQDELDLNRIEQDRRTPWKSKASHSPRTRQHQATKMVELCRYCGEIVPHSGVCKAKGATCSACGK